MNHYLEIESHYMPNVRTKLEATEKNTYPIYIQREQVYIYIDESDTSSTINLFIYS